jgi:PAS domain S-box-containing protein
MSGSFAAPPHEPPPRSWFARLYAGVRRLLSPPVFPRDAEKTRQARVLNAVILVLGGLLIVGLLVGVPFIFSRKLLSALSMSSYLLGLLVSGLLTRRGQVRLAGLVFILSMLVLDTVLIVVSGGIHSVDLMLFLSCTTVAGLVLGPWGALGVGLYSLIAAFVMALLAVAGVRFPEIFPFPSMAVWAILFANTAAIVLPVNITLHSLKEALDRAQQEIAERRQAEELALRQARKLQLLSRVHEAMASKPDLDGTVRAVLDAIVEVFGYTQVSVYLREGDEMVLNYQIGYDHVIERISIDAGVIGRTVRTREAVLIKDVRSDPAFLGAIQGIVSEICVPLFWNNSVVGALNVETTQGVVLTESDLHLMEALATHLNLAFERGRFYQELYERGQRFRALIEKSSDVVSVLDERGVIRYSSPSTGRQLGYNVVELIGRPATAFLHPDDVRRLRQAFVRLLRDPQSSPTMEFRFRHRDGRWAWMEGTATNAIYQSGVNGVILNYRDITERTNRENEIRDFNARLEERVAERTTQLEATMNELESFSYTVAHDLRAPLRGMRGFSQIVLSEHGGRLDNLAADYLRRIIRAAETMSEVIDAQLEFSRLMRATLTPVELDLSAMASAILDAHACREPAREVAISVQDGQTALADEKLIRIALGHLLDNAWKFTSGTPHGSISFASLPSSPIGPLSAPEGTPREGPSNGMGGENGAGAGTIFCIRDNGVGFNQDYGHRLFQPFQRIHRPDEFPGHGVGLAIVQRIINRHGGRVWAEGRVGQGASFYFSLPSPRAGPR